MIKQKGRRNIKRGVEERLVSASLLSYCFGKLVSNLISPNAWACVFH